MNRQSYSVFHCTREQYVFSNHLLSLKIKISHPFVEDTPLVLFLLPIDQKSSPLASELPHGSQEEEPHQLAPPGS